MIHHQAELVSKPLLSLTCRDGGIDVDGDAAGSVGLRDAGFFLEWAWDGKELRVNSHPYGFYPAYYVSSPDTFILSLNWSNLLGALESVEFDMDSLSTFLGMGFWLRDRTAIRGIKAMPEGGEILWRPDEAPRLSKRPRTVPIAYTDRNVLMDEYIDLFRQAISRPCIKSVRLPLSGGLDSRHILFELHRQDMPIDRAVTVRFYPMKQTDDVEIAQTLAGRMGVVHQLIEQETDLVTAELLKNQLNSFSFLQGGWKPVLSKICDSKNFDIFDGIGGDVLSTKLFVHNRDAVACATKGDAHGVVNAIFKPARMWNLPGKAQLIPLMPDAHTRDLMADLVADYFDEHNPVNEFYLWNRTRRLIAANTVGIYGYGRIHAPFLDRSLFDYLRSLPIEILLAQAFHADTVERAYPEYPKLKFAKTTRGRVPVAFRIDSVLKLAQFMRRNGLGGINGAGLFLRGLNMIVKGQPWMFNRLFAQIVYYRQLDLLVQGTSVIYQGGLGRQTP